MRERFTNNGTTRPQEENSKRKKSEAETNNYESERDNSNDGNVMGRVYERQGNNGEGQGIELREGNSGEGTDTNPTLFPITLMHRYKQLNIIL